MDRRAISSNSTPTNTSGALAVVTAFTVWGVLPLFFVLLSHVDATEILAQRVLWALLAVVAIKIALGQGKDLKRIFESRQSVQNFALSSLLIGSNWLIFIYGMKTGQVLQSSLGYFICPLMNVALGILLFGERLRPARAWAVGLATAAVLLLIAFHGQVPYIALSLAATFAFYGVLRKQAKVDPITALYGDAIFLAPLALPFLAYLAYQGNSAFLNEGWLDRGLLIALAPITIVPLGLFAYGAKRLDLATVGFAQYIAPSLQFIVAVFLLHEPFSAIQLGAFSLIWLALALYSGDALAVRRKYVAPTEDGDTVGVARLVEQGCAK